MTETTMVAGIPFHDVGFSKTVDTIERWARDGSEGYVCTPNVDYVVRATRDAEFRAAIVGARLRVPDGMGVIYGSRLGGAPLRETVTGRLLPEAVATRLAGSGISISLFGGPPGAAEAAAGRLRERGADVAVAFAPGMGFRVGSAEDAACVDRLRRSGARVVFVGLGAPKQEIWMARHVHELPNTVLVGVGQAIEVLSGHSRAAPRWMTRIGVEWAFRLVRQPKRLARRYLWDDPRFFYWMLRERLGRG